MVVKVNMVPLVLIDHITALLVVDIMIIIATSIGFGGGDGGPQMIHVVQVPKAHCLLNQYENVKDINQR